MRAPEGWLEYADWRGSAGTVVGRVLVRPRVRNEALRNERHVLVYLPRSLAGEKEEDRDRRYPVVYMHDGQNLFDADTGPGAEWRIDETMEDLAGEGIEAIVVGIPNAHAADPAPPEPRPLEYTPHAHPERGGGGADDYLEFIAGTVKPLVDAAFPALRDPDATGIAGSSLGGLISLYGLFCRADVFAFGGVLSPAFMFDEGRLLAEAAELRPGSRIYVDVGGREGAHKETEPARAELSRLYLDGARAFVERLRGNGFRDGEDLLYVEDADAVHHESAWAARGPTMFRFLLRPWLDRGR
jgi:predicted alpha/beta superfamily hydrolase